MDNKQINEFEGTRVDDHLQMLVRLMDASSEFGVSVGITLYTATGIITGNLIGRQTYFKKFGESFVGAFEARFPGQDWSLLKEYYELRSSTRESVPDGEHKAPAQFIHLDGATLLRDDGSRLTPSGSLWRGSISSIVGFAMGVTQSNS